MNTTDKQEHRDKLKAALAVVDKQARMLQRMKHPMQDQRDAELTLGILDKIRDMGL